MTPNKTKRAGRPKGPDLLKYDGKWMRLKIPADLHKNIRIEAVRNDKNLNSMVIQFLHIGYEASQGKMMAEGSDGR